jgi:hypothetical protein
LTHALKNIDKIHNSVKIPSWSLKDKFISLENLRDIHENVIADLVNDNSQPETSLLGSFGYIAGNTKPQRLKFVELAKKNPSKLKYLATSKFNRSGRFYSWLQIKNKFKYLINLQGHTYCTKIYTMLFCKRTVFYSRPKTVYKWEEDLEPWVHYVPVKEDLSDLLEHYEWAENNPEKAARIAENGYNFVMNNMSPEAMLKKFQFLIQDSFE